MRLLCATNHCTHQAAQLCHAAQTIATLHAQVAALTAERDGLALQLAQARRERDAAKESAEFYLDLFCMTKETHMADWTALLAAYKAALVHEDDEDAVIAELERAELEREGAKE